MKHDLHFLYCSARIGGLLYRRLAYAAASAMVLGRDDLPMSLDELEPLYPFARDLPPGVGAAKARRLLSAQLLAQSLPGQPLPLPRKLSAALKRLAVRLKLTTAEQQLLAVLLLLAKEPSLAGFVNEISCNSSVRYHRLLAWLMLGDDRKDAAVRDLFCGQGLLACLGLSNGVSPYQGQDFLRSIIELGLSPFEMLLEGDADAVEARLMASLRPPQPTDLTLADYAHCASTLPVLLAYLKAAMAQHKPGVNILIHGKPGSGKTELASVLANALSRPLLQVNWEDSDEDGIRPKQRLGLLMLAQRLLERRDSLLLLDEAEDIYSCSPFAEPTFAKATMNHLLENNATPTLWITNDAGAMDAAYIRRFDMVVEMPEMPLEQRRGVVRKHGPCGLSEPIIARLAAEPAASVAVIERAARVVNVVADQAPDFDVDRAVVQMVAATLRAQGHCTRLDRGGLSVPQSLYDLSYLNCGQDPEKLIEGLRACGGARLCLSGPPGTGKTAFASHLAERLELPLVVKRASDLLSKYVGESEQKIAEAFTEAQQRGALLLIDEVDTFLRSRVASAASWENSMVNEMLVQLETFSGFFIATTNLRDALDSAVLRRFDIKLHFDHLLPSQVAQLSRRLARQLAIPVTDDASIDAMTAAIRFATVGDFALLQRRHRFAPLASVEALIDALRQEVALKPEMRRTMGFC